MDFLFTIFTKLADWLVYGLFTISAESRFGSSLHFFIEDVSKIFVLLLVMIYLIALARASMNMDVVRDHLRGRSRWFGYGAGALFGAVTPFCSCSSIPLFLGFTSAGIPTGVTLSFLITSPLLNEVALVLLGSLLGWKFMITYFTVGICVGVLGGLFFDLIGAGNMLSPLAQKMQNSQAQQGSSGAATVKMSIKERHEFAKGEAIEIFLRIWKWVIIGVGIGAGLHGFVPDGWIATNLGTSAWWSVPVAVVMGIPLYSNATGMIPIVETLMIKGLPVGTALALMLSTVGASLPEFIMLKQVLNTKLLFYLFGYFLVAFTAVGWIINLFF